MKKTKAQIAINALRDAKSESLSILRKGGQDFKKHVTDVDQIASESMEPLRLALTGPYAVGKSSLLKALTGSNPTIGGGVTTKEATNHAYKDLLLTDMPGVLAGQFEHDEIARKAMLESDLILFVISNELFNSESLPYFKMAVDTFAKKNQMLLVVNKFDRFNKNGRSTEDSVQFISAVLAEQISPLKIDEFGPAIISAENHLESVTEHDENEKWKLSEKSRFLELINAIDLLVARSGVIARRLVPLQRLLHTLEDALSIALSDDSGSQDKINFLSRKIFAFSESRDKARSALRELRSEMRDNWLKDLPGLISLLQNGTTEDEYNNVISKANTDLGLLVESTSERFNEKTSVFCKDILSRIDEIDSSPLATQIKLEFKNKIGVSYVPPSDTPVMSNAARDALLAGGGQLRDKLVKDSSAVAKNLEGIYKTFGGKFKPWGRVKMERFVGNIGKFLDKYAGPIQIAFAVKDGYNDDKLVQQKLDAEKKRRTAIAELRAQFTTGADQFHKDLVRISEEILDKLYDQPLLNLERISKEILSNVNGRAEIARDIEALVTKIRGAISDCGK